MTAGLFVAAICAVLVSAWWRARARRRRARGLSQEPGRTHDNPLAVDRFDEIDQHLRRARCPCGGVYTVVAEGGAWPGNGAGGRVVKAECGRCEREAFFFFDLSTVQH